MEEMEEKWRKESEMAKKTETSERHSKRVQDLPGIVIEFWPRRGGGQKEIGRNALIRILLRYRQRLVKYNDDCFFVFSMPCYVELRTLTCDERRAHLRRCIPSFLPSGLPDMTRCVPPLTRSLHAGGS